MKFAKESEAWRYIAKCIQKGIDDTIIYDNCDDDGYSNTHQAWYIHPDKPICVGLCESVNRLCWSSDMDFHLWAKMREELRKQARRLLIDPDTFFFPLDADGAKQRIELCNQLANEAELYDEKETVNGSCSTTKDA